MPSKGFVPMIESESLAAANVEQYEGSEERAQGPNLLSKMMECGPIYRRQHESASRRQEEMFRSV